MNSDSIRLRGSLLSQDAELLKLHMALVRGGLITEEEFWTTRESALKSAQALLKQKQVSSFVKENSLGTQSERNKIILTPDTIKKLLGESRNLQRAHFELVNSKILGEKEFWTFFVSSRFFGSQSIIDPSNPLEKFYEEEVEKKSEDGESEKCISPLINLEATEADHFSDYGNRSLVHLVTNKETFKNGEDLISRLNSQATKSLITSTNNNSIYSLEEATFLEDLKMRTKLMSFSLETAINRINTSHAASPQAQMHAVDSKFDGHIFLRNLKAPRDEKISFSHAKIVEIIGTAKGSEISGETIKELSVEAQARHRECVEILSHFWSIFPPGKNQDRLARINRLVIVIQKYMELIDSFSNDDRSLMEPLYASLKHAVSKYPLS